MKMDKKIKFSDQPTSVKVVYAVVIAILCITAVVVGIVSVASRDNTPPDNTDNPPITDGEGNGNGEGDGNETPGGDENTALIITSPVVGEVTKVHSTEIPVFSETLGEWRIHTGIDIATEEGAEVFAAADGEVTKVWSHPHFGKTVEITHNGGIVSVYSNLAADKVTVKEGDAVKAGAKLGAVGDSALTELADEAHLHFEIKVSGVSVNPLDYISEDSKKASLGIEGA